MIKEKLCQGSSSNITIPDAVQANNQKHNFSINKVKSVAFIRSARTSYCTFGRGVGDASLRMHRLHDVLQFFETSLKNRIVKN